MKKYNQNELGSVMPIVLITIIILILALLSFFIFKTGDKKDMQKSTPEYNLNTEQKIKQSENNLDFDDGLHNPTTVKTFPLDETGAGLAISEIFEMDINNDGRKDIITKNRYENGTAHFYYEYKIELKLNNKFVNITPENFKTSEGAECSLQKFRFIQKPNFKIIKISRNWEESWTNPTVATRYFYILRNNEIKEISSKQLIKTDDVSDLF